MAMLGTLQTASSTAHLAARVDELGRVEQLLALVALVASRVAITAQRARSFDVPVRKKPIGPKTKRNEVEIPVPKKPVLVRRNLSDLNKAE
jgi:hypothetical protein